MKKKILIFSLEVIFTVLLISLLVFSRDLSRSYFDQVQDYSSKVSEIESTLSKEKVSNEEVQTAAASVDELDSLLTRFLWLNLIGVPLGVFLLWIVFHSIIWKLLTKISFKRFFLMSLIPSFLFFATVAYFLKYLSAWFYKDTSASLFILILLIVLLIVISYIFLLSVLYPEKKLKEIFTSAVSNVSNFIMPFIAFMAIGFFFLVLIILIFIFTYVGISILVLAILLIIIIGLLNMIRYWLMKKR
ncbi:MAG: hypothetical protein WC595_00995 [Candidatus Nanoarchaeia archaeon]